MEVAFDMKRKFGCALRQRRYNENCGGDDC
jgi:hypothetical protein